MTSGVVSSLLCVHAARIRNTAHITTTPPIQNLRVWLEEELLCLKMSTLQALRASINQRLTMAAEEIFELFERTIAAHKEELCRQFKLSDGAFKPEHQLHRAGLFTQTVILVSDTHAGQLITSFPGCPYLTTWEWGEYCTWVQNCFLSYARPLPSPMSTLYCWCVGETWEISSLQSFRSTLQPS